MNNIWPQGKTLEDTLSNPSALSNNDPPDIFSCSHVINQTVTTIANINSIRAIRKQQKSQKQVNSGQPLGNLAQTNFILFAISAANANSSINRPRSITPPSLQMELIKQKKQKVKIPMKKVEKILPKRIRAITSELEYIERITSMKIPKRQ